MIDNLPLSARWLERRNGSGRREAELRARRLTMLLTLHEAAERLTVSVTTVRRFTVGKILGHSGPQTTARYAHLATATLEKAMRKLR